MSSNRTSSSNSSSETDLEDSFVSTSTNGLTESDSNSSRFIITKKSKVEEDLLEKEAKTLKKISSIQVPVSTNGLKMYLYDLRTCLYRFISKNLFSTIEPGIVDSIYRKICFYLVTIKPSVRKDDFSSIRDALPFDIIKLIIICLAMLSRIKHYENSDYNDEIFSLFELRHVMTCLRRDSLYYVFDEKTRYEYLKVIYNCFWYISERGKIEDEERWDSIIMYETKEGDEGKYLQPSEYFFQFFEVFFYHSIRNILLSVGSVYVEPCDMIFPPKKNIFSFIKLTDSFLEAISQKELMDGITSKNIPLWLTIDMETDFHRRLSNDKNLPPPIVVLQNWRKPDLSKFSRFIKTYNGLTLWWQNFNANRLEKYHTLEDNSYEPVYEEKTREIFAVFFRDLINLDINLLVVSKTNLELPLAVNKFYKSKYPRIINTPRGYCVFDSVCKKLIPYKSFVVCIYIWLFSMANKCFDAGKPIENDDVDLEIERSIGKIIFFVKKNAEIFE